MFSDLNDVERNDYPNMKINLRKIISVFLVSAVLTSFCPVISARNAVGETTLEKFNTSTPQTNLFWFEEYADAFVLLDDKDGKLLLMSENSWGETVFDESGSQKFDPEKNGNIAAWIKNNNPLPEDIKKYIVSSRWETEAGIAGGDCPEEYTIECKEALLSVTELEKSEQKMVFKASAKIAERPGIVT